jgi:hypothetical protein
MRTIVVAWMVVVLNATPAMSQSRRIYFSALGGIDAGSRGPIAGSALPTIGGSVGLRVSQHWSVEAELERGFHTRERSDEALWLSRVGVGATREEIERNGIYARFDRSEHAGFGWSAAAVWNSLSPGRVNAALFAGIGSRTFTMRTVRTITALGPDVDLPPSDQVLQPSDTTRTVTGGGVTGGLRVPIRVSPDLTVGPEFRYTFGIITNDRYSVLRIGGRLTWGF